VGVSALKVASLLVYGCFEVSLFLAVTPLSFGGVSAVFYLAAKCWVFRWDSI